MKFRKQGQCEIPLFFAVLVESEAFIMIIQQAILHIFDFETQLHVFSQQPLNLSNQDVLEFVSKQMESLASDLQHQTATIGATSPLVPLLATYRTTRDFLGLAESLATILGQEFGRCEAMGQADLLVIEFQTAGQQQVACVLLNRKSAYTHHVSHSEDGVSNEIIRHQAILPNSSQKPTTYAIIDMQKETVVYRDRKRMYDGEKRFVLAEIVLTCEQAEQSPKATLKLVNEITAELAATHDIQPSVALAKVKQCLVENAQTATPLAPSEIAKTVFEQEPALQQQFQEKLIEKAVPKQVVIAPKVAERTGKMHTLKTDMGIEIRIPSEHVSNADYIEFINQPDGTIAIQLRNIAKIIDK